MVRLSTHDYAKEGAAVLLNVYKVEEDYFQCDFNEKMCEKEATIAMTLKLSTLGGAIAAFISLYVYSGYVLGHFVKFSNQMDHVRRTSRRTSPSNLLRLIKEVSRRANFKCLWQRFGYI
jgi:hypothetical protein